MSRCSRPSSRSSLAILKCGTNFPGTGTLPPDFGFLPVRGGRHDRGHFRMDAVAAAVAPVPVAIQDPPQGTGDAVRSAADALAGFDGDVLILSGDTPLLSPGLLDESAPVGELVPVRGAAATGEGVRAA